MCNKIKCLFGYHNFTMLEKKYFPPQEISDAQRQKIISERGFNEYFLAKSGFTEEIYICRSCKKYNSEHYVGQ